MNFTHLNHILEPFSANFGSRDSSSFHIELDIPKCAPTSFDSIDSAKVISCQPITSPVLQG